MPRHAAPARPLAARFEGVPFSHGALAAAAVVGAAGAALAGADSATSGAPLLPDMTSVTQALHLTGQSAADLDARSLVEAPAEVVAATSHAVVSHGVAPIAAGIAASPSSAHDAVPELTKAVAAHRQTQRAESAVDRFESTIGSTGYEQYCERAVENAYGTQSRYGSAIEDWRSSEQHTDWQHAPRGALVFYNTSDFGHVAMSLGDGRVVSSSANGQVGIVPVGYFQNPLGWAHPTF